jgi:hypothetical protein
LKKQYEKDMKAFLDAGGEKTSRKRKAKDGDETEGKKKKKDPEAPKRPAGGAFGCFLAANREKFMAACKGQPITAVTKMASEKWKVITDAAKQPFEAEYQQKKAKYDEAMAAYKSGA